MAFFFKKTNKGNIMTEEDEKHFRDNNICRFCENERICDKVLDHCHLKDKDRKPGQQLCKTNFTQKKN